MLHSQNTKEYKNVTCSRESVESTCWSNASYTEKKAWKKKLNTFDVIRKVNAIIVKQKDETLNEPYNEPSV